MKSVSDFRMLNAPPRILATRKTIEAIKHIVKIAPQEAQWFHTVEYDEKSDSLLLGEDLYIPEQICSAAEVDSTPGMMIQFYKELSAKHDMATTNSILDSMTCWCHSHHNMAPNPSAQDVRQFSSFIEQALNQGQSKWQIMLIFNKKDQFYSRVYDPNSGNVYEGVSIDPVEDAFDFSYIDVAAKTKFKSPPPIQKAFEVFPAYKAGFTSKLKDIPSSSYSSLTADSNNTLVADSILSQIFSLKDLVLDKFKFSKKDSQPYIANIQQCLTDKEIVWLYAYLANKKDMILEHYSDEIVNRKFQDLEVSANNFFITTLTSGKFGPDDYKKALKAVFDLDDCTTVSDLILKLKVV